LRGSLAKNCTVDLEVPSGAKKIRNLTLISLGISAIAWLIWGFVSLRTTPCDWIARLKGSECVRIISRDVWVGAEQVYFSRDNSQVLFFDDGNIRIEPVRKKSLFDVGKAIPLISVEHLDTSLGHLKRIVGFALSSNERLAAICALYDVTGSGYEAKLMLMELDHPGSAHVIFPEVYCRYSDLNFIPASRVLSLNSFEGTTNKVLFLNLENNTLRSVPGDYLTNNCENSKTFPVRVEGVESQKIALYSFPELEKSEDFTFPAGLSGAKISPDGDYIFANHGTDAMIYMMDRSSGELAYTFADTIYRDVSVFAISPNGELLAAAFYDYDSHAALYVWDLRDNHVIKKTLIDKRSFVPRSLDFSSDGKSLAIGTWDYVIILDLTK